MTAPVLLSCLGGFKLHYEVGIYVDGQVAADVVVCDCHGFAAIKTDGSTTALWCRHLFVFRRMFENHALAWSREDKCSLPEALGYDFVDTAGVISHAVRVAAAVAAQVSDPTTRNFILLMRNVVVPLLADH